jgi:Icc-related predicted phosphoesterase
MQRERPRGHEVRIAALGDVHYDGSTRGTLIETFSAANRQADILVLCGDMTTHGKPEQMQGLVDEMKGVEIPIVAVLGNHDHESGMVAENVAVLHARGVHVLDGDSVVIDGIGFAGTKGFAGGFGRGALAPFGESEIKEFVQHSLNEAIKLENALRSLPTEHKVAVLHYAPIADTVLGEPEMIYAFLGSSRLLQPLETYGATVIFHGHAHHGTREARTPSGIPVYNVARPLLNESDLEFLIWTVPGPERRGGRSELHVGERTDRAERHARGA